MTKSNFFSAFLKQGKDVGSITPSSKFLVKKMIEPIDFSKAKTIVEFGPGTGVITLEILKNMREDARLIVFEINEEFLTKLRKITDHRMEIVSDSAEHLEKHFSEKGIDKADYIISSLPLAVIPKKTEYAILNSAKKTLRASGSFVQFQYSIASLRKLKDIFDEVKIDFTAVNIPPAFVFTCRINS